MELRVYCTVCNASTRAECTCPRPRSSSSSKSGFFSGPVDATVFLLCVGMGVLGTVQRLVTDFENNWKKVAIVWGTIIAAVVVICLLSHLSTKNPAVLTEWRGAIRRRWSIILLAVLLVIFLAATLMFVFSNLR